MSGLPTVARCVDNPLGTTQQPYARPKQTGLQIELVCRKHERNIMYYIIVWTVYDCSNLTEVQTKLTNLVSKLKFAKLNKNIKKLVTLEYFDVITAFNYPNC